MVYYVFLLCIVSVWQLTNRALCIGTMATTETASLETSVTISVASESSLMENISAKTVSKYGQGKLLSKSRGNKKSRHMKKPFKPQGRRKPQFRSLEPPDACLRWSPNLNVTADTNFRSLTVDFCRQEELPIPSTYTCVTKAEKTLCTVVEKPRCGHVFENLTSGNYTIIVKPLCKSCFDVEVYNRDCITPIYVKNFYLEVADENSSLDQKQSSTTHTGVIVPASCASILLVIILVVYLIARHRHCTKSLSCGHHNTVLNQPLPIFVGQPAADYQTTESSQMLQLDYHDQETIFSDADNSTETDTILTDSDRQPQVQKPLDPEDHSYLHLCVDMSPSVMTLNSGMTRLPSIPSCQTISASSYEVRDMPELEQEESQPHPTENDCQETLQSYFDTDTGISYVPTTLLAIHKSMDIPYHLVFTDT